MVEEFHSSKEQSAAVSESPFHAELASMHEAETTSLTLAKSVRVHKVGTDVEVPDWEEQKKALPQFRPDDLPAPKAMPARENGMKVAEREAQAFNRETNKGAAIDRYAPKFMAAITQTDDDLKRTLANSGYNRIAGDLTGTRQHLQSVYQRYNAMTKMIGGLSFDDATFVTEKVNAYNNGSTRVLSELERKGFKSVANVLRERTEVESNPIWSREKGVMSRVQGVVDDAVGSRHLYADALIAAGRSSQGQRLKTEASAILTRHLVGVGRSNSLEPVSAPLLPMPTRPEKRGPLELKV